jgi:hypothetical protein
MKWFSELFLSAAECFGTKLRKSECFSLFYAMLRNGIPSFFYLPRNSGIPRVYRSAAEKIKIPVCFVFRGIIIFSSENGNPGGGGLDMRRGEGCLLSIQHYSYQNLLGCSISCSKKRAKGKIPEVGKITTFDL